MSLDIYLYETVVCEHCGGTGAIVDNVHSQNITHNLNSMASAAGLYGPLWRPEENGIERGRDLIEPIQAGIAVLQADPDKFKAFNPTNGWGSYDDFIPWLEELLEACKTNRTALVRASR